MSRQARYPLVASMARVSPTATATTTGKNGAMYSVLYPRAKKRLGTCPEKLRELYSCRPKRLEAIATARPIHVR
jgi:hypothetical protein